MLITQNHCETFKGNSILLHAISLNYTKLAFYKNMYLSNCINSFLFN